MYRAAIRERARDGIAAHGSLGAYLSDFRACSKVFEMFVAERMARERGRAFWLWEDLPHEVKAARGLVRRDTGVDVTDGETTIVQCKLRARTVTWAECATFFGCAVAYAGGAYTVLWRELVLARNACSALSPNLAELASTRPFDLPIEMGEFAAFVESTLLEPPALPRAPRDEGPAMLAPRDDLRDYQREAVELCLADAGPAYVVLPTGTGKGVVIAHVASRTAGRVLVLVPLVVLLEQIVAVLARHGLAGVAAVGHNAVDARAARVVVCVFNSAHTLDLGAFERVLIDEAHFVARPAVYADLEQDEAVEAVEAVEAGTGYAAVRAATSMRSARLLSATLDVPRGAPQCTRALRAMIDAGYLCDYTLHVPVFERSASNADLAAHLVRAYRSMLVFCATRAEGLAFCAALVARGAPARYVDCETPRAERRETVGRFVDGTLAFVVNVRVLSVGFDAPITRGVCFVRMPASQTQVVQVIGRCLRRHEDKQMAHVVLPVVEGVEGADARVRDFMRVLSQSDAMLARSLRARGGSHLDVHAATGEADEADEADESSEPAEAEEAREALEEPNLQELLCERIYDSTGRALFGCWDARLAELVAFHAEHGRVPPHGTLLGNWIGKQRARRDTMPAERKAKLEALAWWRWGEHEDWETRLAELESFHAEHGRVPPHGTLLGNWIGTQRASRDTMPAERKAKLEALAWWRWSERAEHEDWETRLAELVAFHAEHGRVPTQAHPLGRWIGTQRKRRDTMPVERKAKLEALAWWRWAERAERAETTDWETRLAELVAFHAEHGGAPTQAHPLGRWINKQRERRETMPAERKAKLDALEWWRWGERETAWETRLAELVAFHAEHGRVPTQGTPLGNWIGTQRWMRETMPAERKAKLDALAWWLWQAPVHSPVEWDARFEELEKFHAENGRAPPDTAGALGEWVLAQHRERETMLPERKAKLDGLVWWKWRGVTWDTRLAALVAYHAERGTLPAAGTPLGAWVNAQRGKRATMRADHKAKLDALPWWPWSEGRAHAAQKVTQKDRWDAQLAELIAYRAEHGHAPPSTSNLGSWASNQRLTREQMREDRKAKLEALEWWTWGSANQDRWCARLAELVAYYAEHAMLPPRESALGVWVDAQRRSTSKSALTPERRAKLDALPWWTYQTPRVEEESVWNARYAELAAYHAEHRAAPPLGTPLGTWTHAQQQTRLALGAERVARLDELPCWKWHSDLSDARWNARHAELLAHHAEHGSAPPPRELAAWVNTQRLYMNKMAPDRKARLSALPCFDSESNAAAEAEAAEAAEWQDTARGLVAYHDENGKMPPAGSALGKWASKQRARRDAMPEDQKAQLCALKWWRWDNSDRWDARLEQMIVYRAEHGRMPPESVPLGLWAHTQRQKRDTMPPERKAKLDTLEWWRWAERQPTARTDWDARLAELVAYRAERGRLPPQVTSLGTWAKMQRQKRDTMAPERKAKLDALEWWRWGARERTDAEDPTDR